MCKNSKLSIFTLLFIFILSGLLFTGCSQNKLKVASEKDSLEASKKIAVEHVHKAAIDISEGIKNLKTDKEKIDFIRNYIDPVRYYEDKTGYFYVYDLNCINIAHAIQKELLDKDLTNYQDTKGKYVIQELSKAAKNGGGYVEFYWQKPGSVGEKRKLGYVEPIAGTNYFIGSGVYLSEN